MSGVRPLVAISSGGQVMGAVRRAWIQGLEMRPWIQGLEMRPWIQGLAERSSWFRNEGFGVAARAAQRGMQDGVPLFSPPLRGTAMRDGLQAGWGLTLRISALWVLIWA